MDTPSESLDPTEALHPHVTPESLYAPHRGARAVATVFKTLSVAIVVLGAAASYFYPRYLHVHFGTNTTQCLFLGFGMLIGTILIASWCAFFGYVLGLLIQVESNTRETAYNVFSGRIPPPPIRHL